MKLENWSAVSDPYQVPEIAGYYLHGIVYGHPRFDDGSEVTTSRIVGIIGDEVLTHSGNLYELGNADSEYESLYPNARARLISFLSIKEFFSSLIERKKII